MARICQITVNGHAFTAQPGELLLDAALKNGIDLPYDCRSGQCGTCCVQLVSGKVSGGEGAEPGTVHACQCRIAGDAVIQRGQRSQLSTIDGVVSVLRPVTSEVMEVGIKVDRALPYLPGQYGRLRFRGYPSRAFSMTHALLSDPDTASIWFHIRRVADGRVSSALGQRILPGHRVTLTGPYGSAHFRPDQTNRMLLVATSTGFAPIWSIAAAALRENPQRAIMVIAGGRKLESLYMAPALERLASFPNVRVIPVCSTPQTAFSSVQYGRPTDYLPHLLPMDVVYACGAPGLVDAIKSVAARSGAVCYADPFVPSSNDEDTGTASPTPTLARPVSLMDRLYPRLAPAGHTLRGPDLPKGSPQLPEHA